MTIYPSLNWIASGRMEAVARRCSPGWRGSGQVILQVQKNSSTSVSNFLDPIWERQKDTGREQKDETNERVAGEGDCSISLCAVVEVKAVGTMYHTLIPAPRNDMRGMTCENGRRQPARRPATERRTNWTADGNSSMKLFLIPWRNSKIKEKREAR